MELPKSKKIPLYAFVSLVVLSIVGFAAFQFGLKKTQTNTADTTQQSEKPVLSPEQALAQDMRKLEARMNHVKKQLEHLDNTSNKLGDSLAELADPVIPELAISQSKLDALPRSPDQKAVVLPPESASAKVLAQPKTASGIPKPVVENYQRETGVNPAEIEALMRRTQ